MLILTPTCTHSVGVRRAYATRYPRKPRRRLPVRPPRPPRRPPRRASRWCFDGCCVCGAGGHLVGRPGALGGRACGITDGVDDLAVRRWRVCSEYTDVFGVLLCLNAKLAVRVRLSAAEWAVAVMRALLSATAVSMPASRAASAASRAASVASAIASAAASAASAAPRTAASARALFSRMVEGDVALSRASSARVASARRSAAAPASSAALSMAAAARSTAVPASVRSAAAPVWSLSASAAVETCMMSCAIRYSSALMSSASVIGSAQNSCSLRLLN